MLFVSETQSIRKMGVAPRKEAVAAMQEVAGKYGQDACENMI